MIPRLKILALVLLPFALGPVSFGQTIPDFPGALNSPAAPVDTDKEGMPDFYETALGWNPAAQDHNILVPGLHDPQCHGRWCGRLGTHRHLHPCLEFHGTRASISQ